LKKNHIILIVVFISPKDLTVRLLETLKVATPILQPVQITEIWLKLCQLYRRISKVSTHRSAQKQNVFVSIIKLLFLVEINKKR
jgi:hypothetical protein